MGRKMGRYEQLIIDIIIGPMLDNLFFISDLLWTLIWVS
jgi:hypothetical protein